MSIITYTGSIKKGVIKTLTLHKTNLAAIIPDDYYADYTNWEQVTLFYKSAKGNQSEEVEFDCSGIGVTATGTYEVSEKSLDLYVIDRLVISDYDNGTYTISRAGLPVSEFDVDTYVAPLTTLYYRNIASDGLPTVGGSPEIFWVGGEGTLVSDHLHLDANEFFGMDFYSDDTTRSLELTVNKEYTLRLGIGAGTVLNTSTTENGQQGFVGDVTIGGDYFPFTEAQRLAINEAGVAGGVTIDIPVVFDLSGGNYPSIGIDTYTGSTMNIWSIELLG